MDLSPDPIDKLALACASICLAGLVIWWAIVAYKDRKRFNRHIRRDPYFTDGAARFQRDLTRLTPEERAYFWNNGRRR